GTSSRISPPTAPRSSSRPSTSRRPTASPTGSPSCTTASSTRKEPRRRSRRRSPARRTPPSTTSSSPSRRPSMADSLALTGRCLRLSLRNVDGLITALALPVLLMLMFVELFGGAIHTGGAYVNYVVPGVLLVCVGFGSAATAVSVSHDLTTGVIDRFRSL